MLSLPLQQAKSVRLCTVLLGLLLSGCQAKEYLNNSLLNFDDKAKLSNYSFTPADKFGVLVTLAPDTPKSMHQPVIAPLTEQLVVMLAEELGVTGVGVDEAVFNQWRDQQRNNRVTVAGEEPAEIDESLFFRQAGHRGFLRVTATETVDKAARNDFDYSLRTKYVLRVLETTDKGDISPALAQFTTVRAVCSRRYRSKDTSSLTAQLSEGYELTNVQRCAATSVYRARHKLAEEK